MQTSLSSAVLAAIGIASLSVALPLASARAQDKPDATPPAQSNAQAGTAVAGGATAGQTFGAAPRSEAGGAPSGQTFGAAAQAAPPRPGGLARGQAVPAAAPGMQWTPVQGEPMPGVAVPMPPMQPGPAPVMVVDGAFLYILRGNEMFKVNKADLRVVAVGMLPGGMAPGLMPNSRARGLAPAPAATRVAPGGPPPARLAPGGAAPAATPGNVRQRRSGGK